MPDYSLDKGLKYYDKHGTWFERLPLDHKGTTQRIRSDGCNESWALEMPLLHEPLWRSHSGRTGRVSSHRTRQRIVPHLREAR